MKNLRNILPYAVISPAILGIIIGPILHSSSYRTICNARDDLNRYFSCRDAYQDFGLYLSLASLFVFVIAIIALIASNSEIRSIWAKFSYWFIPLALIITLVSPGSCGGSISSLLCWSQEWSFMFFSIVYISVSLLILIIKSWILKKENKANELPNKVKD